MKNQNMQKNFIGKLSSLRNLLKSRFPKLDVQKTMECMGRLAHYHYNKRKYLILGSEKEVYNFLIEEGYNPYTIYRWLLLEKLPEEIRWQVKQQQISQKNAFSEAYKRKQETTESLTSSIIDYGLSLVRGM